jgi:hypothetical protein
MPEAYRRQKDAAKNLDEKGGKRFNFPVTKSDYVPGSERLGATASRESAAAESRRLTAIALIKRELPLIEAGDHPILRSTALMRQLLTVLEIS